MKHIAVILIVLLMSFGAQVAWISLDAAAGHDFPSVTRMEISGNDTFFSVTVPGFEALEKSNEYGSFLKPDIPDTGWLMETGAPQVPAIRKNIIVPFGAEVRLSVEAHGVASFQQHPVWPAQPSFKRSDPEPPFTLDERIYERDVLFPIEWGRISNDAVLRDFRFVTVELFPLRTNPITGELLTASEFTISVTASGRESISTDPVFHSFHPIYSNNLANFDMLNIDLRSDPEPMLIICYDDFMSDMAAFVEWKTKRGIDVHLVSSDETGTTSASIRSYIENVWATWDPQPVYILLVGDAPQLQPMTGIGNCASDSLFTLLEGDDLIPDAFISRLSALNSGELNAQLDKILMYEITPPEGENGWLDKFSGIASDEGSGPSDEEYAIEIEERFNAHNPNSVGDRIFQSFGHGATEIANAVNEGRFWLCYLGHGSGTSWFNVPFTNSDVDALMNGYYTPFVMDVSCSNGYFNGPVDCFAERWLKNEEKGAIGMYSSSTTCAWHEPAQLAWGVTFSVTGNSSGTIPGGNYILGQMTLDGILFMYDVFGTTYTAEEVMNQYVLFGDCSLMFRSAAYITPDIDHLPGTPMFPSEFPVTVTDNGAPVEGAVVCAYKPGEVHVTALTNTDGVAILNVAPETIGDMIITVSGQNIFPQESLVNVAPAGCGVVVLDRNEYNCSDEVIITVFDSDLNEDPNVIETVIVEISSDTHPAPIPVLLTETGPDTAVFSGAILTTDSQPGTDYLPVSNNDVILVYYYDEDCDGEPAEVTDTAFVDCIPPEIYNMVITEISTDRFSVTWNTDEPATTNLYWSDTFPPSNPVERTQYRTEHEVQITDLNDCTLYYFMISAVDRAGNRTDDTNMGSYYHVVTQELIVMLDENMDTDPGWTYENLWEWGPASGISGNPPSGHTGTNIVGYNLNGNYQNNLPATYMTTTSFDCSNVSEVFLSFWRWLCVESSTWDHAAIQISNNGGSTWQTVWQHSGGTLTDTSWRYQEYDITTWAAGYNDVRLRWVMGPTDSIIAYCGWNIDDVLVSCVVECTSVPTPTPAPTYTPIPDCMHTGDVNQDGVISAADAQLAFLIVIGAHTPTYDEECAADCNGDGVISAGDAQQIFLTALGQESCVDPL